MGRTRMGRTDGRTNGRTMRRLYAPPKFFGDITIVKFKGFKLRQADFKVNF